MPPIKGQMFRYTEDDMEKAIKAVLGGQPVSTTTYKEYLARATLRLTLFYNVQKENSRIPQRYLEEQGFNFKRNQNSINLKMSIS